MFVKANHGWLVLAHIPLRCEHVEEFLHLRDTRDNRREGKRVKEALEDALRAGNIEAEFARRFPESRALDRLGLKPSIEPTLGEFARSWLDSKSNLTPAARYDYDSLLKVHLEPHALAAMRLSQINDGDIGHFVRDLHAKKKRDGGALSPRRINMVIARLRSIFATAHRRGLIQTDPMRHVENLRQPKAEVDPFDLDEARRIIEVAEGWEQAFLTVLLYTGMRPGEALALHWDAIDWDHGLIRVRFTESRRYGRGLPKTPGSERDVEMIEPVRKALRDQRARSQLKGSLVFPSEAGTAIDLANFRARNWTRVLARAKVRPRTIYQCRHTFARLAIEHGDTPQHVAAQLGHTTVEMVFRVYSRWMTRPASRLAALEKAITHPSPKTGGETAGSHGN